MMGLLQQLLPFLKDQQLGGLQMTAGGEPALRMPRNPVNPAGEVSLQAPANALTLAPQSAMSNNQAQNLAMMLMQAGTPQAATMQPMAMIAPTSPAQAQQFGPQMAMQMQQQNDELMRQRMQGLLSLIGGQR